MNKKKRYLELIEAPAQFRESFDYLVSDGWIPIGKPGKNGKVYSNSGALLSAGTKQRFWRYEEESLIVQEN